MLESLREEVLEANLELVRRGLVLYTFGNVSGIERQAGLVVRRVEVQESVREYNEWVGVTRPPVRRSEHIRRLLQGSVEQDLSGLSVQSEDDTFMFVQQVAWILACKPA